MLITQKWRLEYKTYGREHKDCLSVYLSLLHIENFGELWYNISKHPDLSFWILGENIICHMSVLI